MHCPRNIKYCNPTLIFRAKRRSNFICSGINKKPNNYKYDNINLCAKSVKSKIDIGMTVEEACYIISVLSTTLGFLAPGIIKKEKK